MAVSLDLAITAIKSGRREEGRQLLNLLIQQNPNDEMAWLWMSGVVETSEQRARCLIHVLAINPQNQFARKGLAMLGVTVSDSRPVQIPRDSEPIKITKLPPPESEMASQKTVPLPDIRAKQAPEPGSLETQPLPVKAEVAAPSKPAGKPTEESSASRQPFLINARTITDELPFTPLNAPLKAAVQPPIQASPGILNIKIEPVAGFDTAGVLKAGADEPVTETRPGEATATAPTIEPAGVASTEADKMVPVTVAGADTAPVAAEASEAKPVAEMTAISDDMPAEEATEASLPSTPPERDPILTDTNKLPAIIPPSVRAGAVKKAKKRPNPATDAKSRGGLAAATGGGAARPPSKPVVITGIRNGMANPPAPMQLMPGTAAPMPSDPQFSPMYPPGQPMPGGYPALQPGPMQFQPGLNPAANDPTRATVPLANPYFVPPASHANATMSMPMSAAPDYQRPPSQPVPVQGMGVPYPPLPPGMALHSNATMMMPPMSEAEARAHLATSHAIPTANAAAMPMQNGFGWGGQYMGYPFPPTQAMDMEEDEDDEESGDINILAVLVFGTLSMTAVGGLGMLILLILTTPTM
jgi:hypothetical protein